MAVATSCHDEILINKSEDLLLTDLHLACLIVAHNHHRSQHGCDGGHRAAYEAHIQQHAHNSTLSTACVYTTAQVPFWEHKNDQQGLRCRTCNGLAACLTYADANS